LAKRPAHLNFLDFYKGEPVTVDSSRKAQAIIVPMDAAAEARKKAPLTRMITLRLHQVLSWLQWTVWPLFILSMLAVFITPNAFNWLILGIYSALIASRLRLMLRKPLLSGVVLSPAKKPLQGVVVMLLTADGQLVALDRTTKAGKYAFFTKPGKYTIRVIAEGYSWAEETLGSTQSVELTHRASLTKNISMKPFGTSLETSPFGS
jgi:hypothetical protein